MMTWNRRHSVAIVGIALLTSAVAGYWYYERNKDVIAWVGDFAITKTDFLKEMSYRGGNTTHDFDKQALLDEMIAKKLMLNKAYQLDYHERADVQREYEYLLMGKVRKAFIEEKRRDISVSEEDLKSYYEKNQSDYLIPQKDRLAVLFIKKRSNDVDKNTARLREVQEMAAAGKLTQDAAKGFGEHSIAHSEHQVSRYKGGDIGWFSKSDEVYWEQGVLDAGFALEKPGDLSEIIATNKGYYLVRLMERKVAKYRPFDQVKTQVRHKLILTEQHTIENHFDQSLRADFDISIKDDRLRQLEPSTKYAKDVQPAVPSSGMLN